MKPITQPALITPVIDFNDVYCFLSSDDPFSSPNYAKIYNIQSNYKKEQWVQYALMKYDENVNEFVPIVSPPLLFSMSLENFLSIFKLHKKTYSTNDVPTSIEQLEVR